MQIQEQILINDSSVFVLCVCDLQMQEQILVGKFIFAELQLTPWNLSHFYRLIQVPPILEKIMHLTEDFMHLK